MATDTTIDAKPFLTIDDLHPVHSCDLHASNDLILLGSVEGKAQVRSLQKGTEALYTLDIGKDARITTANFLGENFVVLFAAEEALVYDYAVGEQVWKSPAAAIAVHATQLLVAKQQGVVRIVDSSAATGWQVVEERTFSGTPCAAAFEASVYTVGCTDGTVHIHTVGNEETKTVQAQVALRHHVMYANMLVTADKALQVWDIGCGGQLINTLRGHTRPGSEVSAMAYCEQLDLLVTGSKDGMVRMWRDGALWKEEAVATHSFALGAVHSLSCKAGRSEIAVACQRGLVVVRLSIVPIPSACTTLVNTHAGTKLVSANGLFKLVLLESGTLAVVTIDNGFTNWSLTFDEQSYDGSYALEVESGEVRLGYRTSFGMKILWRRPKTTAIGCQLVMQDDGNLAMYRRQDGTAAWSTKKPAFHVNRVVSVMAARFQLASVETKAIHGDYVTSAMNQTRIEQETTLTSRVTYRNTRRVGIERTGSESTLTKGTLSLTVALPNIVKAYAEAGGAYTCSHSLNLTTEEESSWERTDEHERCVRVPPDSGVKMRSVAMMRDVTVPWSADGVDVCLSNGEGKDLVVRLLKPISGFYKISEPSDIYMEWIQLKVDDKGNWVEDAEPRCGPVELQ